MRITESTADTAVLHEVGSRVARHRLNRNWTQGHLAREAGVSLPTVSRLERGESTTLGSFVRILRALDLLSNLEALVAELPVSPVQQLRIRRQSRQRASGSRRATEAAPWSWRGGRGEHE